MTTRPSTALASGNSRSNLSTRVDNRGTFVEAASGPDGRVLFAGALSPPGAAEETTLVGAAEETTLVGAAEETTSVGAAAAPPLVDMVPVTARGCKKTSDALESVVFYLRVVVVRHCPRRGLRPRHRRATGAVRVLCTIVVIFYFYTYHHCTAAWPSTGTASSPQRPTLSYSTPAPGKLG